MLLLPFHRRFGLGWGTKKSESNLIRLSSETGTRTLVSTVRGWRARPLHYITIFLFCYRCCPIALQRYDIIFNHQTFCVFFLLENVIFVFFCVKLCRNHSFRWLNQDFVLSGWDGMWTKCHNQRPFCLAVSFYRRCAASPVGNISENSHCAMVCGNGCFCVMHLWETSPLIKND